MAQLTFNSHTQVSKYIKVVCFYNLPWTAAFRQSALVSCEPKENEPDEIDFPDVQVLHNPSSASSSSLTFQHVPLFFCVSSFWPLHWLPLSVSAPSMYTAPKQVTTWLSKQQCLILTCCHFQWKPQLYLWSARIMVFLYVLLLVSKAGESPVFLKVHQTTPSAVCEWISPYCDFTNLFTIKIFIVSCQFQVSISQSWTKMFPPVSVPIDQNQQGHCRGWSISAAYKWAAHQTEAPCDPANHTQVNR